MQFTLEITAQQLVERINTHRPFRFPVAWSDEILYPYYQGLSIVNLAQSIPAFFDAPTTHPLDASVWGGQYPENIKRVVVFLSDGLGYELLQELVAEDTALRQDIARFTDGRGFVPLTSVVPSTTVVALTSYWTGLPPIQHGSLGTQIYLPEDDVILNVLFASEKVSRKPIKQFSDISPQDFVKVPALATRLKDAGIATHLVLDKDYYSSFLSQFLYRDVAHFHLYTQTSPFWRKVRSTLRKTRGQRTYVNIYNPLVDGLSHAHGTRSKEVIAEIKKQFLYLNQIMQDDSIRDGQTLLIFCADHGQVDVPRTINFHTEPYLSQIAAASEWVSITGEPRFAYLKLRPHTRSAVIDVLENHLSDLMAWVDVDAALSAELFGYGDITPEIRARLGDLILVLRDGLIFEDKYTTIPVKSMHCGMTSDEMLVPFMYGVI